MQIPQEFTSLLEDAWFKCSMRCQARDVKTIQNRLTHEGLSFLTITLPKFLDDLMVALEHGSVTSDLFIGWKKRLCLPAFLQGFTSRIFDLATGKRRQFCDLESIRALRQILAFYKKEKSLCAPERVKAAFREYRAIEDDLLFTVQDISWTDWEDFSKVARLIWGTVFGSTIDVFDLVPHHGPGSTAERIKGNRKYIPVYNWVAKLASHFSPEYAMYSSEECARDDARYPESPLVCAADAPAVVTAVPKTASKPRVICLEPISMQMCQQGVKDYLVDRLEKHRLTRGHVNFRDQTINQKLALESSSTRMNATIDLSAASDRIHCDFVHKMLEVNPLLRDLIMATRSEYVELEGEILKLNKFASMGSATCFPIESMFFYTLCVLGLLRSKSLPPTMRNVVRACRQCYVYGDDIVVPTQSIDSVLHTLTVFGNVVGTKKSFYKGNFRESCGMDAYAGVCITPVYKREPFPQQSRRESSRIISAVATANQLYNKGWCRTAYTIRSIVERITGALPVSKADIGGLAWVFGECNAKKRYSKRLQRFEVQTLVAKAVYASDRIDGFQALFKCLMRLHRANSAADERYDLLDSVYREALVTDDKHLERTPRRGAVTLQRRWAPAL